MPLRSGDVISPEEMMERYRRGVVGLDDAADYFYKRLHPRRYRWLDRASRRVERYERLRVYYTGVESVGRFAVAAVTRGLLALFSIHYRRTSGILGDMVRANRPPELTGGRPAAPVPRRLWLPIVGLSTGLVILSVWVPLATLRQRQHFGRILADEGVIGLALTRPGIGIQSGWVALIALLVCIGWARAAPRGACAPLEKLTDAASVALVCYSAAFAATWGLSYGGIFTMGCVGLVGLVVWVPSALALLLCLPVSVYYAIFPRRRSAQAGMTRVGEEKG